VNAAGWVSMIAMTGWLILALSAYRSHRPGARKTLLWATAWLGLFWLVAGVFTLIGG